MDGDWIVRLGVLVPSGNAVFEKDAHRVLPSEITTHISRLRLSEDTPEQLRGLIDSVPQSAELLADAGISAIAFACTTGSLIGGAGYDERISRIIYDHTQIAATTTATAVVEALRTASVTSVVLVSPYEPWLNAKVVAFLEEYGFHVVAQHGFGLPRPHDIAAVLPEEIARAVRAIDSEQANGVFISCTDFRGIEAAELLTDLGKPVVTSNQATLWKLLRMTGTTIHGPWLGVLAHSPGSAE